MGTIKMATRSAALKLDWTKVTSSLGLRGQTVSSLQAFKKRNEDARRRLQVLAEQPKTADDLELKDLAATLKNIESARPFEDLTVDEVAAAEKSIDEKTNELVSKGRWMVPGYKEKF